MQSNFVKASRLSFQLPDGRWLFQNLDFSMGLLKCGLVGRNGVGKSTLLQLITGELKPTSGSIARGGRLSVLPQNLVSAANSSNGNPRDRVAEVMGVDQRLKALDRILAGDTSPALFDLIADQWDLAEKCERTLSSIGLRGLALDRPWSTLSCGERMRVLFARLLLEEPDFILMDEPSNHLDRPGREYLMRFINEFSGGLLIISHDREILNDLDQTWELSEHGLRVYGGGFEFYSDMRKTEQAAAQHGIESARQTLERREDEQQAGRERQLKRIAKGKKVGEAGGIPRIIRGALKRKAQVTLGKTLEKNETLVSEAKADFEAARTRLRSEDRIKLDLDEEARLPSGKTAVEAVDFNVKLPGESGPLWRTPLHFSLHGSERLAIEGPNGAGKTTLLQEIAAAARAFGERGEAGKRPRLSGSLRVNASVAYLDQTVSFLEREGTLLEAYTDHTPHLTEAERRIRLARFLFPGEQAHSLCRSLSGGERLRAGLLCLLSQRPAPSVLILDEPTNNLDLTSIETLETALGETELALIVVSHDARFLDAIGIEKRLKLEKA